MREMKYQAWYNGKMYAINMIIWYSETNIVYGLTDPKVPGSQIHVGINEAQRREYTGLKDCKGKEIYGGDICTVKDGMVYSSTAHRMIEGHYQVYWNDDRWGLRHGEFEDYDNGDYYRGDEITWRECEVIGNIYEHPELLEAIA